jgi:hypothetical protein
MSSEQRFIFDLIFILEFHNEFNEPPFRFPLPRDATVNLDLPPLTAEICNLSGFSLKNHSLGTTLYRWSADAKASLNWHGNSNHCRQDGPR